MDFSYSNKNNDVQKFSINIGDSWSQLRVDNEVLNSIFSKVDTNKDGTVQEKEINLLAELFKTAKKLLKGSDGNETLDENELVELNTALENAQKVNIIDTRKTTSPENFQYINICNIDDEIISTLREEDYSFFDFTKLEPGQYYLVRNNQFVPQNGKTIAYSFDAFKVQDEWNDNYKNWSEGLNRRIGSIKLAANNNSTKEIINELKAIGEELGFNVELVYSNGQWIEDYSIRRHDGKVLLQGNDEFDFISDDAMSDIMKERISISTVPQGAAAQGGKTKEYSKTVSNGDFVNGKSYLEGGNVLNTIKNDGTPGAIIGQEPISYTLELLKKENPSANEEMAKQAIAEDLGLSVEDITFIPQFDFHIDMSYRPLRDGEIAVPDYEAGIELIKNIDISGMGSEQKSKFISELEQLLEKTKSITDEAENKLSKSGYKIVKVPCFSIPNKKNGILINYMNGIGGTDKTDNTFYITNKSDYPELDEKMKEFFIQNCNIGKIFFVSTKSHLSLMGGIDCLTQEASPAKDENI